MSRERPLVSFCLITYNQEHLVRAALEGAFSQTYQPLEIVLSDDASPDGTHALLEASAREYRGPHQVKVRRNTRNLGLTGHVNAVVEAAAGELIFLAAGDDVSLPERVERTVERWEAEGRPRGSLCTGYREIDANGNPFPGRPPAPLPPSPHDLADWARRGCWPLVVGATHAFHRDLYNVFGPLLPDHGSEDMPLAMRALALDGVFYIPEPLVLYRRHLDNLAAYVEDRKSFSQEVYKEHLRYARRVQFLEQVLCDFQHPAFTAKWGGAAMRKASRAVARTRRKWEVLSAWMAAGREPVAHGILKKAWSWPPMIQAGSRLLLRAAFPGLQRAVFEYLDRRSKANYQRTRT